MSSPVSTRVLSIMEEALEGTVFGGVVGGVPKARDLAHPGASRPLIGIKPR